MTALALSAKDVAHLLGVSTRQIWSMNSSGQIGPAPIKLSPRTTRWDRREVEAWWCASREDGRPITRSEWLARQRGDDV